MVIPLYKIKRRLRISIDKLKEIEDMKQSIIKCETYKDISDYCYYIIDYINKHNKQKVMKK